MKKKKYYAVKRGRKIGIFESWEVCSTLVYGYPGAEFKSFFTYKEAETYMNQKPKTSPITKEKVVSSSSGQAPYAFVDGSYNSEAKVYGFGGFLIANGKKTILTGSGERPDMISMRNVSGEILGAKKAVETALKMGLASLIIYYDYSGIEAWANDKWSANTSGTKEYKEYMQEAMKKINISFVKVKGHSGIEGNEEADRLAKYAVGLLSDNEIQKDDGERLTNQYGKKSVVKVVPKLRNYDIGKIPTGISYFKGIPFGKCPACGCEVDATQRYCSKCGQFLCWELGGVEK